MSIFSRATRILSCNINDRVRLEEDITDSNLDKYVEGLKDGIYSNICLNIKDPEIIADLVFPNITYLRLSGKGLPIDIVCNCFPNLFSLNLYDCKRVSHLDWMNNNPGLKCLSVWKSKIECKTNLVYLDELSIDAHHLEFNSLKSFGSVRALSLFNTKNAHNAGLSGMKELKKIVLMWERKGTYHLDDLSGLPKLQGMYLDRASQITALPNLSKNPNFKVVDITLCNKLEDLSGLYEAPGLEVVSIVSCDALKPEAFFPLKNHPTLKKVFFGAFPQQQKPLIDLFEDRWWHDRWSNTGFVYILPEIV